MIETMDALDQLLDLGVEQAEADDPGAARRRAAGLDRLNEALAHELDVPAPVTQIGRSYRGTVPLLSVPAVELARQVYYLHHGSIRDAARAIIAAGLAEGLDHHTQDAVTVVGGRLMNWWRRERWPKRPTKHVFLFRDANHDGGLYRAVRRCRGVTTGNGAQKAGEPCTQSPLTDSEYCFQHDPRPEYAEKRRRRGAAFVRSRMKDMVDAGPLRAWWDAERRQLLADAQASGARLDPKQQGWGLLSHAIGVDASIIAKVMQGESTSTRPESRSAGRIRAATVVKYLDGTGVSFRDVYGFDPPAAHDLSAVTCPDCGQRMSHGSKRCRTCHEARLGEPCAYVNGRGERCNIPTRHPDGYCHKCSQIMHRRANPKPRHGRPSFVSVPMLLLATDEWLRVPNHEWVAKKMWAANAGGCADVFSSHRVLASSLVKQFRKRGFTDAPSVLAGRDRLAAQNGGDVWWPAPGRELVGIEGGGMVPFEPFRAWLAARYREVRSYKALADRIAIGDDTLSKWIRGVGRGAGKTTVRRALVDRALELWGDGTTFADVYGGQS